MVRHSEFCPQFSSVAQLCPTLCDTMNHSTSGLPTITNSWSSLKLMSIKLVMPSSHLILCHPLLLPPSVFPLTLIKFKGQRKLLFWSANIKENCCCIFKTSTVLGNQTTWGSCRSVVSTWITLFLQWSTILQKVLTVWSKEKICFSTFHGKHTGTFLKITEIILMFSSVQFSSVAQLCPTLCDPMNRSTPGLPVHHHLPEFTQTHIHRVCDAIQPSHPQLSPSPTALNPSQHQSLFQWVNSSHEMAKVLEFQLWKHHSFQRIPRTDLL